MAVKESKTTYPSSKYWCKGCEHYEPDCKCAYGPAVNYGKRLGNRKKFIPGWLVRGTDYCVRDADGNLK